jgi:DeoR family transcriptional regulator of aga operon
VVVLGGTLRPMQHSLVDPMGALPLEQINADLVFLGCNGIEAEAGVTNANLPEAEIKRRMLRASSRRVVVADGSKVGDVSRSRMCGVEDVHLLITGASASDEAVAALRERALEVQVAR